MGCVLIVVGTQTPMVKPLALFYGNYPMRDSSNYDYYQLV